MNGILFGNKHTYDDWDLVLTGKSLGLPTPKTSSVDVDGADGSIDTSEVLSGEIKFSNRRLEFELTMTTDYDEYNELVTNITNYLLIIKRSKVIFQIIFERLNKRPHE